jgi:gamma-glutamylcyclotransferase (GGCT)/AIG2-like uncharacterized protein YtfP
MKIFAYGSNMCSARLHDRVPSARPVGTAFLSRHNLRFHKRGFRDGSGKADASASAVRDAGVWGVVYQIDPGEKADLDRAEGLGRGYDEKQVLVTDTDGVRHRAWMYCASPVAIDPAAVPFAWYMELVRAGAEEHGLPEAYTRARIASRPTRPDPDAARAARHRAILVPARA